MFVTLFFFSGFCGVCICLWCGEHCWVDFGVGIVEKGDELGGLKVGWKNWVLVVQ